MAIKLTEEDIIKNPESITIRPLHCVFTVNELKQQILENQEKSEKWDKMKQYLYFDEKNGAVQDKQYNLDELIRLRELVEETVTRLSTHKDHQSKEYIESCKLIVDNLQSLLDKAKGE